MPQRLRAAVSVTALAAPAAAGIPVTFRGVSGSVAICTGQDATGNVPAGLARVAAAVDTLVVLMPLTGLDRLCGELLTSLDASTPAALIAEATSDDQRVLRAPLGNLAHAAHNAQLTAPATLIIGRVVDVLDRDAAFPSPARRSPVRERFDRRQD